MKKIIFALCSMALLFTLVSCGGKKDISDNKKSVEASEKNDLVSSENTKKIDEQVLEQEQESWGITMWVSDVTPQGLTLTIAQSGGTFKGELQTGAAYKLSKLENDTWVEVPYVNGVATWNMPAFNIPTDGEYTSNLDWSSIYGSLSAGKYRVEKEIMNFRETGNFNKKTFSTEFEITDEWCISMSATDVTTDGLTLIISQNGGEFDGELLTGSYYKLQKLTDNIWTDVPYVLGDNVVYAWDDVAHIIGKSDVTQMPVNWNWFYGSLEPGKYRIEKLIMGYIEPGVYGKKSYYAEFTIDLGEYKKVSDLKADNVDTNILFKFNGILFGKSFVLIDYANFGEPIGEITKLIDKTLVPQIDGETNSQELLGALVYECDDNSAVLYYGNVYHLFQRIP